MAENQQPLKYKLVLNGEPDLEEIKNRVDRGATFVVFQYYTSVLFVITFPRVSPAYFIESADEARKLAKKYNWRSLLLGWGSAMNMLRSVGSNKKGGHDVTEDIILNLTEEGLNDKEVEIKETNLLFCEPNKSDLKPFQKSLTKDFEYKYDVVELVVAWFINTPDEIEPHYVIGVRCKGEFNTQVGLLEESLYTVFTSQSYFEFLDLSIEDKTNNLLREQGTVLISRTLTR